MKKWNVILADDHAIVRDGLQQKLENTDDFMVTASCNSADELFDSLQKGVQADLVVLDLSMPGMNGFDAAAKLKKEYPTIKVIILSIYLGEFAQIELLSRGARAVLNKNIATEKIVEALREVAATGYCFRDDLCLSIAAVFNSEDKRAAIENLTLTDDQIGFIRCSCTELTYKNFAEELNIKENAVESLRIKTWEKCGVRSRVKLVQFAIKNGLVQI